MSNRLSHFKCGCKNPNWVGYIDCRYLGSTKNIDYVQFLEKYLQKQLIQHNQWKYERQKTTTSIITSKDRTFLSSSLKFISSNASDHSLSYSSENFCPISVGLLGSLRSAMFGFPSLTLSPTILLNLQV